MTKISIPKLKSVEKPTFSKIPLLHYNFPPQKKTVNLKSIITKYIENPLLLDGRKFSLKVFVLILNTKPLVSLFREGYLLLASRKYDLSKIKGPKAKLIHFGETVLLK